MTQPRQVPGPSLELIFETIHGFQRTGALKAALELDVFTGIADGAHTAITLARRAEASERGMRILCDYLAVLGLLTKTAERYELTPDSHAFLNKKSPLMALPAELLADLLAVEQDAKLRVLDIAAGHGLYGIAIAKRNPNAEITAVDWANVLEVALENARAAGVGERFRTLVGSAFEVDYGDGYDVVLLVNFLHHFDPATVEEVLRKVYQALRGSGRAAILEFIPNEDRISPRVPAAFSMMMLPTTPHGDAYTFSEYKRLLRDAGFSSSELYDLQPTYFRVVLARK